MSDERRWLSMHFAIVLTVDNKISEKDILLLLTANLSAMHLVSEGSGRGYTPIHLLCMQKRPSVSLVRKICLRDPQAFLLYNHSRKSALHMVAQYSESLESLQSLTDQDSCRLIIH
jgi:hypothetical protein